MRFMEEPVRQQAPFTSNDAAVKFNQPIRDEIARQTAEFLKRGGKIDCGKPTHNTLEQPAYESDLQKTLAKKRSKAQRTVASKTFLQTPVGFHDGKNRRNDRASSGHQNISMKTLSDGRKSYSVVIGSSRVGTFYDETEALTARDNFRKANGLEKALY